MKKESTKVYISGRVTGMPLEDARQFFAEAETVLEDEGFHFLNPMALNHDHDKTWIKFMQHDIKALLACDAIYLLPNWGMSRGARIERIIAMECGMPMVYAAHEHALDELAMKPIFRNHENDEALCDHIISALVEYMQVDNQEALPLHINKDYEDSLVGRIKIALYKELTAHVEYHEEFFQAELHTI